MILCNDNVHVKIWVKLEKDCEQIAESKLLLRAPCCHWVAQAVSHTRFKLTVCVQPPSRPKKNGSVCTSRPYSPFSTRSVGNYVLVTPRSPCLRKVRSRWGRATPYVHPRRFAYIKHMQWIASFLMHQEAIKHIFLQNPNARCFIDDRKVLSRRRQVAFCIFQQSRYFLQGALRWLKTATKGIACFKHWPYKCQPCLSQLRTGRPCHHSTLFRKLKQYFMMRRWNAHCAWL